ncbi:MAG TPA: hypothetical protein PLJ29_02070, partial [Leptospiraceae bacterium]|nr:hypothetical protein [Leptospiraceae bacterium]
LKHQQATQKNNEWIKFLNFEITELINKFKEKVEAVNKKLEDGKIFFEEGHASPNSTLRKVKISFGNKSINIGFINHNEIENNDKQLKERSINFQKQRYNGFIMQNPSDSYFKTNNIVIIGLAETSFKIVDYEFGFNLVLKKIDGSNYGEWMLMQFSENITPPKTNFGIDLNRFFETFEKLHHSSFHTTTLRPLVDEDISSLIEKILIG